uniref:C-type lectin domain-containing protein n=1 Tax=Romanomermis culicivorax TaxID=13658 RepID=A0A915IBH4_ROMCU
MSLFINSSMSSLLLGMTGKGIFIGAFKDSMDGIYKWYDYYPLESWGWKPGMPTGLNDCVCYFISDKYLSNCNCGQQKFYACQNVNASEP